MTLYKSRFATTHLDKQGERFPKEVVQSLVKQGNEKIIPFDVEHDPRKSPIGRLISATFVELPDGEFAAEGIIEGFDEGTKNLSDVGEKEIGIPEFRHGRYNIQYDIAYKNPEDQGSIQELSIILKNAEIHENAKKAEVPIIELAIGIGIVILGSISDGFFSEFGKDSYLAIKEKIKELIQRHKNRGVDSLLEFEFSTEISGETIHVLIILSNPDDNEINLFFDEGIPRLDEFIINCLGNSKQIKRIVIEYRNRRFRMAYKLTNKGIPL
jgi:hypothetical protein